MKQAKKVSETDVPQYMMEKKVIPHKKLHSIPHQKILKRLPKSYERFSNFLASAPTDYYSRNSRQDSKPFSKQDAKDLLNILTKLFRRHYPQNAQQIKLNFSSKNARSIDDEGLQALGSLLAGNFPKLRRLDLCFERNNLFTHNGLEMFTLAINRNLSRLKTLSLDFDHCWSIDRTILTTLGSNLFKGPDSFCNLSLNFGSCCNISNARIESFAQGVQRSLVKLQRLNLNFDDCEDLEKDGFETLAEAIATGLSDLEYLTIYFGLTLRNPSYDYGDGRSDNSDDSDQQERMERSIRHYLEDKQEEREEIEEYLKERLDFIPKLKLIQDVSY